MKIKGYASVFNVIDSHNDIILPGAFSKTLKFIKQYDHTIPIFFDHDENTVIGKITKIKELKKGLWIEAEIFDSTHAGKIKTLLNNGVQLGFSIGFTVITETNFNPKHKTYSTITAGSRKITDIHLEEVSVVKWPSNSHCVVKCIP